MLFNSLSFLLFFPLTTLIYFLLPHRGRWAWLLAIGCYFYAAFIPAYLWILVGVIAIDYVAGLVIERAKGRLRTVCLVVSLVANVGVLAAFKYFNFANDNLRELARLIHWNYPVHNLGMLLPVGLSFHTFQSMAYTIEVYRGNQRAERHLGVYALYVMFYPQLVAGPIERPQNMLHQFHERHRFDADRVFDGLKQMLWGMFKKVVIADRMAIVVDTYYRDPAHVGGAYLVLATWFFAIQIYCDFSGYTDIAIGAARVLGYDLMTNFDRPYAARSVAEFWRRWHISLSTWFRDYLYIPLGGSRVALPRWCFNVMVVFVVSGLWHGASWTFAIWGALHGLYLVGSRLTAGLRKRLADRIGLAALPAALRHAWQVAVTFNLVCLAWVFFRAHSFAHAMAILHGMIANRSTAAPEAPLTVMGKPLFGVQDLWVDGALIALLLGGEWLQSRGVHEASSDIHRRPAWVLDRQPTWVRWPALYALLLAIFWIGQLGGRTFIYFQF